MSRESIQPCPAVMHMELAPLAASTFLSGPSGTVLLHGAPYRDSRKPFPVRACPPSIARCFFFA